MLHPLSAMTRVVTFHGWMLCGWMMRRGLRYPITCEKSKLALARRLQDTNFICFLRAFRALRPFARSISAFLIGDKVRSPLRHSCSKLFHLNLVAHSNRARVRVLEVAIFITLWTPRNVPGVIQQRHRCCISAIKNNHGGGGACTDRYI